MNGNVNGAISDAPIQMSLDQMVAALDPAIGAVVQTMIRGIIASAGGAPAHVVLNLIAWKTGNFLASTVVADIANTVMVRKAFREAFDDGVRKAPMTAPAAPMPVNEAAALANIFRKGH
jgi:hypothetical protein